MISIGILKNTIQEYDWGSITAIPELLGESASGKPQAELWMGAHPKAPSLVNIDEKWVSLLELIENNPIDVLGKDASEKFNGRLPYLFKVLAAERPLSIQSHPSLYQAKKGFEREALLGIPINAPERNYRDDNHKPECICALSEFLALAGFRSIEEMIHYLKQLCSEALEKEIDILANHRDSLGLKIFFQSLMTISSERKKYAVSEAVSKARLLIQTGDPVFDRILRLYKEYPEDIGVISPLFLNMISLRPGQALFLAAGEPHAYLEGLAIELMANSDNVLRCGLTAKHVDISELMNVLSFSPKNVEVIIPGKISLAEMVYDTPAEEFSLSVITLLPELTWSSPVKRSAEIILCTDGSVVIESSDKALTLSKGKSVLVPASVRKYHIYGKGTCYRASVPL